MFAVGRPAVPSQTTVPTSSTIQMEVRLQRHLKSGEVVHRDSFLSKGDLVRIGPAISDPIIASSLCDVRDLYDLLVFERDRQKLPWTRLRQGLERP